MKTNEECDIDMNKVAEWFNAYKQRFADDLADILKSDNCAFEFSFDTKCYRVQSRCKIGEMYISISGVQLDTQDKEAQINQEKAKC